MINDDEKVSENVAQTNEAKAKTKLRKVLRKKVDEKTKKCTAKKVWKIPPTLLEKNKKYHVITGEVSFSSTVPIGPNSVEKKAPSITIELVV
ncbi:hypothetical protein [Bacillus tropicus]|uniref:hypothetical protein n=1 Tax=Bacillus tropicus TaxID=2026188 RepID=UPI0037FE8F61